MTDCSPRLGGVRSRDETSMGAEPCGVLLGQTREMCPGVLQVKQMGLPSAVQELGLPLRLVWFLGPPCCSLISNLANFVFSLSICLVKPAMEDAACYWIAETSIGSSCLWPSLHKASSTSSCSVSVFIASEREAGDDLRTALTISLFKRLFR